MADYRGPSYGEIRASMAGENSPLERGDDMVERAGSVTAELRRLGEVMDQNMKLLEILQQHIEPALIPEYEQAEGNIAMTTQSPSDRVSPMAERLADYTAMARRQGRRIQTIIERIDV